MERREGAKVFRFFCGHLEKIHVWGWNTRSAAAINWLQWGHLFIMFLYASAYWLNFPCGFNSHSGDSFLFFFFFTSKDMQSYCLQTMQLCFLLSKQLHFLLLFFCLITWTRRDDSGCYPIPVIELVLEVWDKGNMRWFQFMDNRAKVFLLI